MSCSDSTLGCIRGCVSGPGLDPGLPWPGLPASCLAGSREGPDKLLVEALADEDDFGHLLLVRAPRASVILAKN